MSAKNKTTGLTKCTESANEKVRMEGRKDRVNFSALVTLFFIVIYVGTEASHVLLWVAGLWRVRCEVWRSVIQQLVRLTCQCCV